MLKNLPSQRVETCPLRELLSLSSRAAFQQVTPATQPPENGGSANRNGLADRFRCDRSLRKRIAATRRLGPDAEGSQRLGDVALQAGPHSGRFGDKMGVVVADPLDHRRRCAAADDHYRNVRPSPFAADHF